MDQDAESHDCCYCYYYSCRCLSKRCIVLDELALLPVLVPIYYVPDLVYRVIVFDIFYADEEVAGEDVRNFWEFFFQDYFPSTFFK